MKKISLLFLLLLLAAKIIFAQEPPTKDFTIDYFGFPLKMQCPVVPGKTAADSMKNLVAKNSEEIKDCFDALKNLSANYQIEGYAQVLLYAKLVESLPGSKKAGPRASFADAALNSQPLSKNDQIALLFALISQAGWGTVLYETDAGYVINLKIKDKIEGIADLSFPGFFFWQPGKSFTDLPPIYRKRRIFHKVVSDGRPLAFDRIPQIPWLMTKEGREVSFQSPEGCPQEWNFKVSRLPSYEEFLSLWPRSDTVLAPIAYQILTPFDFDNVFRPRPYNMSEERFGTCLLNWVQVNTDYDQKHADDSVARNKKVSANAMSAADFDPNSQLRNPLEILFTIRKGICTELSITLIAILEAAGFPGENIIMLAYNPRTPKAHINLAVAPLTSDLPKDASYIEINGDQYYIMDPAYYIRDPKQKIITAWGDNFVKDAKGAIVYQGKRR